MEFGISDPKGGEIYNKVKPFLDILETKPDHYMKLKSEGYEDLVFEKIGQNEFSMAHYYEKNGDLMRDPEVTFTIKNSTLIPLSFCQDDMGVFYECEGESVERIDDLKEFMVMWTNNIHEQGFLSETEENSNEEEEIEQ